MSTWYYERALQLIESYIWDLPEPCSRMKKDRFAQYSYMRWAVDELYDFVEKHPDIPPLESVEMFITKMDNYIYVNKNNSFIFSVARDIALDVFDVLMAAI